MIFDKIYKRFVVFVLTIFTLFPMTMSNNLEYHVKLISINTNSSEPGIQATIPIIEHTFLTMVNAAFDMYRSYGINFKVNWSIS